MLVVSPLVFHKHCFPLFLERIAPTLLPTGKNKNPLLTTTKEAATMKREVSNVCGILTVILTLIYVN
jgi:hypothetical protein